jgi:hypothetical protein
MHPRLRPFSIRWRYPISVFENGSAESTLRVHPRCTLFSRFAVSGYLSNTTNLTRRLIYALKFALAKPLKRKKKAKDVFDIFGL